MIQGNTGLQGAGENYGERYRGLGEDIREYGSMNVCKGQIGGTEGDMGLQGAVRGLQS